MCNKSSIRPFYGAAQPSASHIRRISLPPSRFLRKMDKKKKRLPKGQNALINHMFLTDMRKRLQADIL